MFLETLKMLPHFGEAQCMFQPETKSTIVENSMPSETANLLLNFSGQFYSSLGILKRIHGKWFGFPKEDILKTEPCMAMVTLDQRAENTGPKAST